MPTAQVNDITINYVDAGQGEPLVLVHNIIASVHAFDFNIPEFSKHYRTVAFDLRGHGLSSKPESESDYSFEILAEDLYQLLKQLDIDSCYLLGQAAVGVGAIFTFFLRHPEMVKALISVSGSTIAQVRSTEAAARTQSQFDRIREAARTGGMMAALEERKSSMLFWIPKTLEDPAIYNRFEEMYRQTAVPAFLALPERFTEERRQAIIDHVASHLVPKMLILGSLDSAPQEQVAGMRMVAPDLHAVMLPDCGHYPAIENPRDFNAAVLNFIAGAKLYQS
ncbi:MAG TPA: alpha/beta hydrolase [Dehalococcoidia bacterium]|nr:alpha/beta hydrolase [Dehalococcoidia bacterium]